MGGFWESWTIVGVVFLEERLVEGCTHLAIWIDWGGWGCTCVDTKYLFFIDGIQIKKQPLTTKLDCVDRRGPGACFAVAPVLQTRVET
jgi:hypothetical protein